MKDVRLTIIGFGAVGKGFAEVLLKKQRFLEKNYGINLKVSAVCEIDGSVVNEEGVNLEKALTLAAEKKLNEHDDWNTMKSLEAIKEIGSDIVLELTPSDIKTGQPGLSHIRESLKKGKHVVTSNKAPLAVKFSELRKLAGDNHVELKYEATVGGVLPIINLKKHCLQINKIESIHGILNGTSNYVLSKMADEGVSMEAVLKEAKNLGIMEADPSYDIEGIDTGAKVVILANSMMDMDVSFSDIDVTGIEDVTAEAIELAQKHNSVVKLIGDVNGLKVSPRLVPVNHPLNVSGTLNAVMINTDVAKNITVIGHGAGRIETASSLFSDILDILQ
ncbi:MAG: homoserine dehydrogenase [Candidatus Altiarchaeota archaeon]|nr:homoserine dehydrogenase [Candidatus Altiarchaeota archaeon]